MEPHDLTELALETSKTYRIKIYDKQPFPDDAPHRQIREPSLGKMYEGEYLGPQACQDTGVEKLEFKLNETRELFDNKQGSVIGSFHIWLIESITRIDRTQPQWQSAIDEDMLLIKSALVNADGEHFDAVHELAVARKEARRLVSDIERYAKDSFDITLEQLNGVRL